MLVATPVVTLCYSLEIDLTSEQQEAILRNVRTRIPHGISSYYRDGHLHIELTGSTKKDVLETAVGVLTEAGYGWNGERWEKPA